MTNGIIPGLVLPKHEFYKDPFIMTCHRLLYSSFSSSHTFSYYGIRNLSLLLLFPFVLIPSAVKQVFKYSNILMRDLWLQSWSAKTWLFHLHCSCRVEKKVELNFERNFPMYEIFLFKKNLIFYCNSFTQQTFKSSNLHHFYLFLFYSLQTLNILKVWLKILHDFPQDFGAMTTKCKVKMYCRVHSS